MSSDVPPRDPAASELMPCGYGYGYHAEALDVETLWRHRHSSRYSSMHFSPVHVLLTWASFIKREAPARLKIRCCTKVIMSGVNSNVIMSGWRDDNPDDERREAARGYTKSI